MWRRRLGRSFYGDRSWALGGNLGRDDSRMYSSRFGRTDC